MISRRTNSASANAKLKAEAEAFVTKQTNGEQPPAQPESEPTPNTPDVTITDYADAVAKGKAIVADLDDVWWRLCALADAVETRWGEKTMERFFYDVGVDCVGKRRLSVYRAYKGQFEAPGPRSSYSVMRALQTHPERAEIIRKTPDMTKGKADEVMKAHRKSVASYSSPPSASRSSSGASSFERSPMSPRQADQWFKNVLTDANTASAAAAEVTERARTADPDNVLEPDLRAVLRQTLRGQEKLFRAALAPSIAAMREGAEKGQQLLDFFEQLVSEDEGEGEAEAEAEELASDEAPLVANGDDDSAEARKAFYAAEEANVTAEAEAAVEPVA